MYDSHLKEFAGCGSPLNVHAQRQAQVVLEQGRQVLRIRDCGSSVSCDEVQCLKGVLVQVRRLSLNHLCESR